MRRCLATLLFLASLSAIAETPYLVQMPSVSATHIAFAWAGQIWTVPREGGQATRLVAGSGRLSHPVFSPDGSMVAFNGDYDGNVDVYVVPSRGGQPRRLTWHPGPEDVLTWTPDGKRVAFLSTRKSANDPQQMYTIAVEGGPATEVPLPRVEEASYSPDGTHLAYQPNFQWQPAWKGYRGGQTRTVWLADLADSSIVRIPQLDNSNDSNPMWIGNRVYFLSDRKGPIALYSHDIASKNIAEVVPNEGLDISSASAGPGAIVYAKPGALYLLDLATGNSRKVALEINADIPFMAPHFEKIDAASGIANAAISPTGQRAVFEAHGEILTVPVEKGDPRNITNTTGAMERDPSWSPDGKWIAAFSDESGEYALTIRNQNGLGEVRRIALPPSFYYDPIWSPDNKRIAFSDKKLNLWSVDVVSGKTQLVDTDLNDSPMRAFDAAWSPDSKWLTYTKLMRNQQHVVFVHSFATGKATQVTDTLSDARFPQFDANGKYLYFTASTDVGLGAGWLDMSSIGRPQTRNVYAAVLKKGEPSPVPLQSDEEKIEEKKEGAAEKSTPAREAKKDEKDEKKPEAVEVKIDFEGLGQRIVSLPIEAENYVGMLAGKSGQLFLMQLPIVVIADDTPPFDVTRFDLEKRKTEPLLHGASAFAISADGEKMLYRSGATWTIAGTDKAPGGDGALPVASLRVYIDPLAEWKQMYREVWRIERDFLYDPHFHGLDIAAAEKAYEPFLAGAGGRDDLNYLFREMTGNISVGHTFVSKGLRPPVTPAKVGLLGADYAVENGRYRFARVFNGENWNPSLIAPLTVPGVDVREGEYLLAVNGRDVRPTDDVHRAFLGTAGVQTSIRVGPNADGSGARDVTVVPISDEQGLRNLAWIEDNRRKVDALSNGRIAYVWLPDTGNGGYTNFNRWFLSQVGKEGAVVDERFNHGGLLSDYIIEVLRREPMAAVMGREGEDYTEPVAAIFGPKAMIINQFAGSGGDALPWYFKRTNIGPLVGTRTWGGLVGIGGYPTLMDGGQVTAPRWALYGLNGQFGVENIGIAPDIEVEQDPKLVREGHDPQLERAVAVVLEQLNAHPLPKYARPPYPVFKHPLPRWP
jgi:tricorn protease